MSEAQFYMPTLGELLDKELQPREHLITPWLRQGESAMIYAPTGVGKSMFALSLALAVAGGGQFMEWKSPRPRRVLFVDGEMHLEDTQARARLLLPSITGYDPALIRENFRLLARQAQAPDVPFPNLAEPEGREIMEQGAKGFDLVVLDNLSTLATVEDENSVAAFQPILQFLMRMKQLGKACILIHHTGKGKDTYRGSSMLATTFEVILGLEALGGMRAAHGTAFRLKWDKYRGQKDESVRSWEAWLEGGTWKWEVSKHEEVDLLVAEVRTGEYSTQKGLAEALGWDTSKVSRLKQQALSLGKIKEGEWSRLLGEARGGYHKERVQEEPDF